MSKISEQVYISLRKRIMSGDLEPGAQIKEEHLAAEMNVSRTPVRTAIQQLVSDGLLIPGEKRGAFVAQWTDRDIAEVFEIRIMLESAACGLAAANATPEQITRLRHLTDEMSHLSSLSGDQVAADLQRVNSQIHLALLEASNSARLRHAAMQFVDVPIIIGSFYLYKKPDMIRSAHHHEEIMAAIERKDRLLAEELMRVHLRSAYRTFEASRVRKTAPAISINSGDHDRSQSKQQQ
ncbi:GntR family transcriptional regulator [Orrella marina]|uniref:GntR family transcriptional regulator n=1 Tax=Orrella marina TaxID=2163011 RepID=A0A2R4XGC4_9BURK|nr:GntR family transcriptional regulator [Orrella marina]AWB32841.1 GntR family transcriptional regulator [Orrella marina]